MALRTFKLTRVMWAPRSVLGYRQCGITAAQVKELRTKSGAPMMECKKALQDSEVNGDINKAMDWLRAKGIAKATSQNTRIAAEGLIAVYENNGKVTMVEVNSETDFVSRNSSFQKFVAMVANCANTLDCGELSVDAVMALRASDSNGQLVTLQAILGDITTSIREKIVVRRVTNIEAFSGNCVAASYIHGKVVPGEGDDILPGVEMGREAAVVCLQSTGGSQNTVPVLVQAGKRLAMHVVAAKPSYLRVEDVPTSVIESERAIFKEQTLAAPPKNLAMMDKIIDGKLNKRLAELTLTGQNHMAAEGSPVVAKYLQSLEGEAACRDLTISGYWRWSLGQLAAAEKE